MTERDEKKQGDAVDYKSTIRLPQTPFPMRANLAQREPETLARWNQERVYERAMAARAGGERYVFHDGPPYANARIHYGHILNKILKDFVVKYQTLAGRYAKFVPGWDCHGLPIELNVERAIAAKKGEVSQSVIRAACRKEAEKWVDVQREEFRRLGVFATWETPYLTLTPSFERGILEALAAFVKHGLVYRGKKPVHWCGSCKTALAEAEVEYIDHESPSIYVKFAVAPDDATRALKRCGLQPSAASSLHALIWTTTPWTLPANLAIAVHPDFDYVLVDAGGGELWIVAAGLREAVAKATDRELTVVGHAVKGSALVGLAARHPFEDRGSPLLAADYVTLDTGTGLVHTAPGHGADDYSLGQANGLDTFAPVDETARFTNEVRAEWRGLHVLEANPKIVSFLHEHKVLANRPGASIKHSYPACWRCKNPIIFRATTQWFIALDTPLAGRDDKKTLRTIALEEIDAIASGRDLPLQAGRTPSGFIPEWGRERIHGMLRDRPDWCISRQRAWGVPIPALHCKQCAHVTLDAALLANVAEIVGHDGADAWWNRDASAFVPAGYTCPDCGKSEWSKDTSILDVWFESGASFWSTMRSVEDGFGLPTDLYLEGSDQHRGWFHSSLLVGAAVLGRAPYKRVLTHGFVCDDQGRPYSKSELRRRQEAGENVEYIEPEKLIKQQGAELLRLWVAYEDFRGDMRFSAEHMKQVSDAYFKIRNTLRFFLGTIADWKPGTVITQLDPLDAWAQARMRKYLRDVVQAYERYDFRSVYHATLEISVGDWSQFYLDVVKDRLYCDAADSPRRLSSQSALDAIARGTITALAPLISFTADEAYRCLPGKEHSSVFVDQDGTIGTKLQAPFLTAADDALLAAGEKLFGVRDALNAAFEPKVKAKEIGHRREVAAVITLPDELRAQLLSVTPDLAEAFAVASVELRSGSTLSAEAHKTSALQCGRCWRHRDDVGHEEAHPALCVRCASVVAKLGTAS